MFYRFNQTIRFMTFVVYKGRVSYTPGQGGLTINNLTVEDEGTITCEVTDENLANLVGSTQLKIFCKFVRT